MNEWMDGWMDGWGVDKTTTVTGCFPAMTLKRMYVCMYFYRGLCLSVCRSLNGLESQAGVEKGSLN